MDDSKLLRTYVETGSERSFAEFVQKHLPLVYSAALRQTGDSHRAQEVTQMVFTDLARKARKLADHPALVAWLHRSTKWAACDLFRAERRRGMRDGAALQLGATDEVSQNVDWEQLRPVLDESLDKLGQLDRAAILLRFFDGLRYAEVGTRLNLSEVAARIRVKRALEKLQSQLVRRGITSAASALSILLANNVIAATPSGLTQSIAMSALTSTVAAGSTAVSFKALLFSKSQIITYAVCLALVGGFLWQKQSLAVESGELHAAQVRSADLHKAVNLAKINLAAENAALGVIENLPDNLSRLPSSMTAKQQERAQYMPLARRLELDSVYAPLFRRLRLANETLDALKELLAERKQALYEAQQIAGWGGLFNPVPTVGEWRMIQAAAASEIDERVCKVIGEEAFAYFAEYERSSKTRQRLRELAAYLRYSSTPLRDAQMDQIAGYMKNVGEDPALLANFNLGGRMISAEMQAAESVLEAEQLTKLRDIEAGKAAFIELNRLNAEAALAGKIELRNDPPYPKAKPLKQSEKSVSENP